MPIGIKEPLFGRWSLNLEGPHIVSNVYDWGACRLFFMEGEEFDKKINDKYLKSYYSTIWEVMQEAL